METVELYLQRCGRLFHRRPPARLSSLAFALLAVSVPGLAAHASSGDGSINLVEPQQAAVGFQPCSGQQLEQVVAPIALYPDSLIAQVVAAAAFPAQLEAADRFAVENAGVPPNRLADLASAQPWDPSVKALIAFPGVLHAFAQNMVWTTELGNVYYNQPQDVFGAVQVLRQRAYAAGNLHTTPQLAVNYTADTISIAPTDPDIVYIPSYNPWLTYGAPLQAYPDFTWAPPANEVYSTGAGLHFAAGISVGAFTGFGWGFHAWSPRWAAGDIVFNSSTYVSNSTSVYNHDHFGSGYNSGGPMIPNHNPGGPMVPSQNPGGPMIPSHNPGGPMIPNHNPGGPVIRNLPATRASAGQRRMRAHSTPQEHSMARPAPQHEPR